MGQQDAVNKQRQQQEIGKTLSDSAEFIRTLARNQDYFTGYTTAEAMQERISQIGKQDDGEVEVFNGQLTRLSTLNARYKQITEAIKQALDLGGIAVVSYDSSGVPMEDDYEIDPPQDASETKTA